MSNPEQNVSNGAKKAESKIRAIFVTANLRIDWDETPERIDALVKLLTDFVAESKRKRPDATG